MKRTLLTALTALLLIGCGPAFNEGTVTGKYIKKAETTYFYMPMSVGGKPGGIMQSRERGERYVVAYSNGLSSTEFEVDSETYAALRVGGHFSVSRYNADRQ